MKARYKFWYAAIFSILFLNACKKDGDLNSKELLVFIKSGEGNLHAANMVFKRTPLAASGDSIVKIAAYLTRETATDVVVNIIADESKIEDYNTINKTKFVLLPAANYKIIGGNDLKISAGRIVSTDSLKIQLIDRVNMTDDNGYILPLSIRNVTASDKGLKASGNYGTVYVIVKGIYSNIDNIQTPLAGTLASRTGWVLSVSNTTSGALGSAMVDGSNTTAWRSSNSSTALKWVVVDMGSAQQIKGFRLVPNYVAVAENATTINISTSVDNVTWKSQGEWKGVGPASGSTATAPDLKHINLINTVQARYFRFDITSWTSGSRVGIGELNVVQ